jgi:threonine/homoserine/homoserine lactone efflux protein
MTYTEILNHLWLGFTSSFLGTLPLGMLNLTILQLALAKKREQAFWFSLGATVIEFLQIGITLLGMNVLLTIPQLSQGIALISIPVLLYLGFVNLKKRSDTEGASLTTKSAFRQGMVLAFANVVVYPYWLLWGHLFVQNGWLQPTPTAYFYFSFSAAIGTLGAFLFFILLGKIMWKRLNRVQYVIDKVIAFSFFGFAAFQFFKLIGV